MSDLVEHPASSLDAQQARSSVVGRQSVDRFGTATLAGAAACTCWVAGRAVVAVFALPHAVATTAKAVAARKVFHVVFAAMIVSVCPEVACPPLAHNGRLSRALAHRHHSLDVLRPALRFDI